MEQKIIDVITEQLKGLAGINIEVINQDSPRIGHFIIIGFKRTDTELVCRWYKQGSYFDCWYRRKRGGNYKIRPYNSDVLYRLQDLQSVNKFCELITLGQELKTDAPTN